MDVVLRYRFSGPMTVGRNKPLPSGRVYHLAFAQEREIAVDAQDADALLVFKGECCGSRTKQPLFERV
jgi:hypothetical protein